MADSRHSPKKDKRIFFIGFSFRPAGILQNFQLFWFFVKTSPALGSGISTKYLIPLAWRNETERTSVEKHNRKIYYEPFLSTVVSPSTAMTPNKFSPFFPFFQMEDFHLQLCECNKHPIHCIIFKVTLTLWWKKNFHFLDVMISGRD